jgi:O-antigen ligase
LQIPLSIVVADLASVGTQPANMSHPTQNGTANYEAHNTILDVFTQGGVLAVASFVWLLLRATKYVYRARSAELMALVAGTAIFMMTGNIIRQPIFWFAIVLCLTAPTSPFEQRGPARM